MTKITDIEGIGPSYADKLKQAGVAGTKSLLQHGATAKGRKQIASMSGLGESHLLKWVNYADLFRIRGVGGEYAELLEAAGVDSVPELARRNSTNLCQKMNDVNEAKSLVRKLPVQSQIDEWIKQAKLLPKIVTH
jgi:predicted flap endonuclease-1-like 5' DNA nuclease